MRVMPLKEGCCSNLAFSCVYWRQSRILSRRVCRKHYRRLSCWQRKRLSYRSRNDGVWSQHVQHLSLRVFSVRQIFNSLAAFSRPNFIISVESKRILNFHIGWSLNLQDFLNHIVLVDRRSAKRTKQGCITLLKMLDKVVIACLMELVRLVALKLNDLVLVDHLLVTKDALTALRL